MEMTTTPMSREEIVDTLKTMVFGPQAFERFSAKERETLDKAWNMIDQYEARLKADMVAMLTEIQLELDEMKITKVRSAGFAPYSKDPFRRGINCSKEIIQQKINSLKENKDGNDK